MLRYRECKLCPNLGKLGANLSKKCEKIGIDCDFLIEQMSSPWTLGDSFKKGGLGYIEEIKLHIQW